MSHADKPLNTISDAERNDIAEGVGTMTRRRFLAALAAVGASPFMATIGCSSMHRGFEKLSETAIPTTNQVMGGSTLIRTNDGGYFAVIRCMSDVDFCWFDAQGKPLRTIKQDIGSRIYGVMQTRDSSFYVAGRGCADRSVWGLPKDLPDEELWSFPYLQKLDANGELQPFRINIPYQQVRHAIIRQILDVDDGIVLIGGKAIEKPNEIPDKPFARDVPIEAAWITRIHADGSIAWEYLITEDDNSYVWVDGESNFVLPPVLDVNGNITAFFSVTAFTRDKNGKYDYHLPLNHGPRRILAVKLDQSGKEIARNSFLDNTALCMAYRSGKYSLITGHHSSCFTLDDKLQKIKDTPLQGMSDFVPYLALPATQPDELLLFGDNSPPGSDGPHAALASMDASGRVSHLMPLGRGTNAYGMVPGHGSDEVTILYTPSTGVGPMSVAASSGMVLARYRMVM
jgi:hypothetical protein